MERLNVSEAMKQVERDTERFHDGALVVFHVVAVSCGW